MQANEVYMLKGCEEEPIKVRLEQTGNKRVLDMGMLLLERTQDGDMTIKEV